MDKGFSLSCSTSFLKAEIKTSPVSSLAKGDVKLRVTSLFVLLVCLFSTAAVVIGQGTQSDAAALIAEAKSLLKKNDYAKALTLIQKAISTDPRNPDAYVQLALIHSSMDDDNKARMAVEEALRIDPNYAPAHQQRGAQLRRAKDFEGAIRELKLALSLKPDPEFAAYAHLSLALTYEELKRYDEALNEYREAIRSNPTDGSLHGRLGSALFELKRFDEAENAYRRAFEIDPLDSNAAVNLAASLQNQAKRDESIKYYREYIRLDPKAKNRATIEQRISQLESTPEPLLRNQMLLVTAQEGDAANVASLIKSGADPNYKSSYDSQTPLSAAASKGSLEVVKLLLSRGAKDDDGTALTNAYEAGNADIEKLLQQAAPPTLKARSRLLSAVLDRGDTARAQSLIESGVDAAGLDAALLSVVEKDAELIEIVRLLLNKGARVNQPGVRRTPLMLAIDRDHLETIKLLLAKGADVNAIVDRDTALAIAVKANNAAVVRLLLAAGADATAEDLLYFASSAPWGLTDEDANPYPERTSEILQLLLDKGANAKSAEGDRALMNVNSLERVKFLLARGANPNAKGSDGLTPLIAAADRGDKQIVEALLSAGADVNAQDWHGNTALIRLLDASKDRRKRNVEDYLVLMTTLLRAKNVNVNLANKNGETALMRAVRLGNVEPVRLLLSASANPNAADKIGETAYILVYKNPYTEIEKLLTTAAAPQNTPGSLNAFLVAAIGKKDPAKVQELLKQGADPNYHYPPGLEVSGTPSPVLMLAVKVGDAAIVQMLVDKGADVNAKGVIFGSESGLVTGTPLEATKNPQIIEILKKAANKNIPQ
jgi:ankyrin repeat protein/Flp pilus assembly protein TadD